MEKNQDIHTLFRDSNFSSEQFPETAAAEGH
jgi:hypothetical protein